MSLSFRIVFRVSFKGLSIGHFSISPSLTLLVKLQRDLEPLLDHLSIDEVFRLPLFLQEVLIRYSETAEQLDHASVEVAKTVSAAANDVETQVVGLELDLTISELDLLSLKLRLHHHDTLGSGKSDLKCSHVLVVEVFGCSLGQLG